MNERILSSEAVVAGYTPAVDILRGLDLHVDRGELVSIVGSNGAGKSTLLKAVLGLVPVRGGRIRFGERDITGERTHRIVRAGVGYVPQIANVFPSLTVQENLDLGDVRASRAQARVRMERMRALFPPLADAWRRPAGLLSGGQRQMVAMARALMAEPSLLLLDEPSAGLSPQFVDVVFAQIEAVRQAGVTVLLVEQNARRALAACDRGYVLDLGCTRFEGSGAELLASETVVDLYLGRAAPERDR